MKLTKIFAVVLSAALCAGVLAGCGGSGSSQPAASTPASSAGTTEVDVQAIADAILAANPISNQYAMDDNTVKLDVMLPEGSYTAYAGWKSNDQSDAGHIYVVQYTEGNESVVADALEAYRQNQVVFFGNYPEFADAQAKLENDYELCSGNGVVILCVASNECTDVDAMIQTANGFIG